MTIHNGESSWPLLMRNDLSSIAANEPGATHLTLTASSEASCPSFVG